MAMDGLGGLLRPVHDLPELGDAVDIAFGPAFDKLRHVLAAGPAQEVETHLLKIAGQALRPATGPRGPTD